MGRPRRSASSLTVAALGYLGQGWSIIPIRNDPQGHKRPACRRWKQYQTHCPTPQQIRRLFSKPDLTGLAVILGQVSGGLYARDFDRQAAYQAWAEAFPELAQMLPTVKTKKGYHVYANHPEAVRTRHFADGELRGERHHLVLPPSEHPAGGKYEWLHPFTAPVPLHPTEGGLDRPWLGNGSGEISPFVTQVTQVTHVVRDGEEGHPNTGGSVLPLAQLLERAQPEEDHQNNKKLFYLARGVKALEQQEGRPWDERRLKQEVFLPWYRANRHLRQGQSQDEYWFEFLRAYDAVKCPLGETFLDRAWAAAERTSLPEVARQFEDPEIRQLVLWCQELQRLAGGQPFFLSVRSVQARFRLSQPMQAWRRLDGLVLSGILDPVEKGSPRTRKATQYRYLPPLEDGPGVEEGREIVSG